MLRADDVKVVDGDICPSIYSWRNAMKYMLLIYADEHAWTEAERQHCYGESTQLAHVLQANGQFLGASPLQPVSTATSVQVRNGKRLVTDGPFAETREQLGGYFMVEAKNLDEAIDIAGRIPGRAQRHGRDSSSGGASKPAQSLEQERTMRFMMILKATKDSEAGRPPNPKLVAAPAKLAEEANKAGVIVDSGGLLPSSQGVRIRVAGGNVSVIDNLAETKELVGGYAIFDLKSKEEAIEAGTNFMQVHADILGPAYEGELEIRPIFGAHSNGAKELNSYLHFKGQCEEAFKFYEKCLDGKIDSMFRYEGTPAAEQVSPEWRSKIVHARMTVGEQVLMGMDAPPERFQKPQGFNLNIGVKDTAEGKRIFQALADGGNVVMPFGPTFWAAGFGMLVDRFGIPWMINCEQT